MGSTAVVRTEAMTMRSLAAELLRRAQQISESDWAAKGVMQSVDPVYAGVMTAATIPAVVAASS
jgi:hypothetical protein